MAIALVETGLATTDPYNHLTLTPALCPYLRRQLDAAERESLTARWVAAMGGYVEFLVQQQGQKAEIATTLTLLELPNLFALLDHVQRAGDAEATIDLATSLYSLLQIVGKPRLLEHVTQVRDAAAAALGQAWNHARFEAQRTEIEQQLGGGRLLDAVDSAQELLRRARQESETAYPGADYDLAGAHYLLGQTLVAGGKSEKALYFLSEALERFESISKERASDAAKCMSALCHFRRGDCFRTLGRLDEAAAAYKETVHRAEELGAERDIAVGQGQLAAVRLLQHRYEEALQAYEEARERFTRLGEPGSIAVSWHQIGIVYQEAGQPEAAEDAYRKALALEVRLGSVPDQAATLLQLGSLYGNLLDRPEEAVTFYRQAADKYVELQDEAGEGLTRSNLANALWNLRRFEEARQEIHRALECKAEFGHASESWITWAVLSDIETADGKPAAAAEAKRKAVDYYLAYRRAGGENHNPDGRLSRAVTQALLAADSAAAASALPMENDVPAWFRSFLQALQAIIAGNRDRSLAENPELDYTSAAEILLLLDTLDPP